jgi:ribosomal protein L20A (L18A)
MSRLFRFIQNEDVYKSFQELKSTVLLERPVVIARDGDYSLFMKRLSDDDLQLVTENTAKKNVIQDRVYVMTQTTPELVARGVRHACQKMAELSDEDVNRRRLQIWKWYIMDWQTQNMTTTKELVEKELVWNDEASFSQQDILDMESYLHGDYLNLGHTIGLIEKYLAGNERHLEEFRKFAIEDIMEMTSEDTRDKSLAEAEQKRVEEGMKKHTYRFTVTVEASDKEHARAALLSYLAGDERIKVQK